MTSLSAIKARQLITNMRHDEAEDESFINLCAYDNALSNTAAGFLKSPLSYRYRIGTFDPDVSQRADKSGLVLRRFTQLDELEKAAHAACFSMFGGVTVDLRPLSGVHATMAIILAATNPGDVVYSIDPRFAGHFATRHMLERAGRISKYLAWDEQRHTLVLDDIERQFKEHHPSFILLDHSAPLVPINVVALRELAGPGTIIDFDASHSMGLIAGGLFQNPLAEGCDILHGNTHKSFPGPQKGLIVFNDRDLAKRVQANLDAGLVSSLHTHHLIALCISLLEMQLWGKDYAAQIIANAAALREELNALKFNLRTPPTQKPRSHILLIDTPGEDEGYNWFERLHQAWVSVNVRPLFGRTVMRLGVQEVTRRGFIEEDMTQLARIINKAVHGSASKIKDIAAEAAALRKTKTQIQYSFDVADMSKISSLRTSKKDEAANVQQEHFREKLPWTV